MSYKHYYGLNLFGEKYIISKCISEKSSGSKYVVEIESDRDDFSTSPVTFKIFINGELNTLALNGWSFFPSLSGTVKASMYYRNYTDLTLNCINPDGIHETFRLYKNTSSYEDMSQLIIKVIEAISLYKTIDDYKKFNVDIEGKKSLQTCIRDLEKLNDVIELLSNTEEENDYSLKGLKMKTLSDYDKIKKRLQSIKIEELW